jgi:signal transduction histidine kinase
MKPFLKWLGARVEFVVLSAALVTIASLVVWWVFYIRRLLQQQQTVWIELAALRHPQDSVAAANMLDGLSAVQARTAFMVAGESSVLGLALLACVGVLFMIARRRTQQRQQLERLLQVTSHELKTPIAGVRALLQSIGRGSIPQAVMSDLVNAGIGECDRLEHLAETILAYQRSVVRNTVDVLQRAELGQLVSEILMHRKETGIHEEVSFISASLVPALVDRDSLRVILENVLDNVRKYGGAKCEVNVRGDRSQAELSIRDFGPGFAPALSEALFDPFHRDRHEGIVHGSGLGLHIARRLAERMNGQLSANSQGPGFGATFLLTLPLLAEHSGGSVGQKDSRH